MEVGRDDLEEDIDVDVEEIQGREDGKGPIFLSFFGTLRGRWHLSFLFVDPWCFATWVECASAFHRYCSVSLIDETLLIDIIAVSRANLR